MGETGSTVIDDAMQPLKLVIYSDYVCPWCYVGQAPVERLKAERAVEVDWRPFFLHPETPPEGLRMSREARERWGPTRDRLRKMAADANMPMVFPELISNTRRALEATEYARERGKLEEFHRLVEAAYYGERRDVNDWSVLRAAAEEARLDADEMQRLTDEGHYREAVDASIAEAVALGVSGVPTYILEDRYAIVGAQPYEVFRQVLDRLEQDGSSS
jgi:predicted DsbA family dithiol-disulfide isomerase